MTRRLALWIAMAVVATSALLYAAIDEGEPRTDADRAYAVSKTIGCPVCDGQSVAESNATVAKNIRISIATWIDEGRSDEFIRAELRAAFGDDVDYTPSADGITSLVWILPVVFGAGALTGLAIVFRRWKQEGDLEASEADTALVEAARAALSDE
ncbi:MAG: cytochrome c-type biogenesis protein CcmH [Acidimicrobiales bacterium]